jgi:hypothetical protein
MTFSDLIQIGIDNYDDMFNILKEIKNLPSSIKRIGLSFLLLYKLYFSVYF